MSILRMPALQSATTDAIFRHDHYPKAAQTMNVAQTLDRLRADADFCRNLTKWHTIPPRDARDAPFPEAMHPDLVAGMRKRGIHQLYTHQADAIAATLAGGHTCVVTPTAQGLERAPI